MKKLHYFKYSYPLWVHGIISVFSLIMALIYVFAFAENSLYWANKLGLGIIISLITYLTTFIVSYVPIRTRMWRKK